MNELVKALVKKINDREFVVGVLGLGYVGQPLAQTFLHAGFQVLGIDVNQATVDVVTKALGPFYPETFTATTDLSQLPQCDAVLICVPTPLGMNKQPDLNAVCQAGMEVGTRLRKGQLIVLESTTYPGTTREVLLPIVDQGRCYHSIQNNTTEMMPGEEWFVAYSPERVDPGRDILLKDVPKVVGGIETNSYELAKALYASAFREVVGVSNAETAEAVKLLENIYRAVNIALVNELKCIFHDMSIPEIPIDIWEVIQGANTKPYGFQAFYPGPGVGGHCIPLDPFYLSWKAKEVGWPTRFIELAGEINDHMPDYVVQRTMLSLNEKGKALSQSKILVLGVAYKPDVDDARESPGVRIFHKFRKLGAAVWYDDPHVETLGDDTSYALLEDAPEMEDFDAVVVVTAHKAYDWKEIQSKAKLIVDTRNVVSGENVVRA